MTDRHAEIRAALKHATPGPWQWWTSNSWKRLKHDGKGETQNVLEPYVAHDGHPDLGVSLSDMAYIAACHPEAIRALLAERDALREALVLAEDMLCRQENEMRSLGAHEPCAESAILTARAALAQEQGGSDVE